MHLLISLLVLLTLSSFSDADTTSNGYTGNGENENLGIGTDYSSSEELDGSQASITAWPSAQPVPRNGGFGGSLGGQASGRDQKFGKLPTGFSQQIGGLPQGLNQQIRGIPHGLNQQVGGLPQGFGQQYGGFSQQFGGYNQGHSRFQHSINSVPNGYSHSNYEGGQIGHPGGIGRPIDGAGSLDGLGSDCAGYNAAPIVAADPCGHISSPPLQSTGLNEGYLGISGGTHQLRRAMKQPVKHLKGLVRYEKSKQKLAKRHLYRRRDGKKGKRCRGSRRRGASCGGVGGGPSVPSLPADPCAGLSSSVILSTGCGEDHGQGPIGGLGQAYDQGVDSGIIGQAYEYGQEAIEGDYGQGQLASGFDQGLGQGNFEGFGQHQLGALGQGQLIGGFGQDQLQAFGQGGKQSLEQFSGNGHQLDWNSENISGAGNGELAVHHAALLRGLNADVESKGPVPNAKTLFKAWKNGQNNEQINFEPVDEPKPTPEGTRRTRYLQ